MNPGESFTSTGILARVLLISIMVEVTSSEVNFPLITSTNFMIGTGFIKCIPIILSALSVTEAISVIEIDEVFDARIVCLSQTLSSCAKIFSFSSLFSVAASTTSSTPFTPSVISV